LEKLKLLLDGLYVHYGETGWWPAKTADEILIGAILTQNTSWRNVEKALENLRASGNLSLRSISSMDVAELASLIRPSGFYNQKARRLVDISRAIIERYGGIQGMKGRPIGELSGFLKDLKGIGQETLDSILNYVLDWPVFVVDKYTLRIVERFGITHGGPEHLKKMVQNLLSNDVDRIKNAHGMLVYLGKDHCRTEPLCDSCPVRKDCSFYLRKNS